MNQFLSLNFMEPLKSILSGGWSLIITWLSEWNRVEALAVGTPSLTRYVLLPSWERSPPHSFGQPNDFIAAKMGLRGLYAFLGKLE